MSSPKLCPACNSPHIHRILAGWVCDDCHVRWWDDQDADNGWVESLLHQGGRDAEQGG